MISKIDKILLQSLRGFLLITLFFTSSVFSQTDESWKVFDDSELAVIDITVDPAVLAWMYNPNNFTSDSIHAASIRFKNANIDETVDSIGFRLRGNTSRFSRKKSFKLSFNSFNQGGNFYGLEKLNLNGEHNDPSIARSKICWDLFEEIGMIASRAAHAAVYINGEYYGLYINVEHIDEEFIEKNFPDDSGKLWKCLYKSDLTYQGTDQQVYADPGVAGFNYDLKADPDEKDYSELIQFIDILNHVTPDEFVDSVEAMLKVSDVLKYFAFNLFVGSWDDYRFLSNNYYLYFNPTSGQFNIIPYDYDNTFGIDWFSINWENMDPYNYQSINNEPRPLSRKLLEVDKYRNLYTHFLEIMNDKIYQLPLWDNNLESLRSKLEPYALQDNYRTLDYGFTMNDFTNSFGVQHYNNQHVKRGIKEYMDLRHYSLYTQLTYDNAEPFIYNLHWTPEHPGPEDTIFVYAYAFGYPAVNEMKIQFHPGMLTVVEEFPMEFNPNNTSIVPEEHDRWIGKIPPLGPNGNGRFTVEAGNSLSNSVMYRGGELIRIEAGGAVSMQLLINELLARNKFVIQDEHGDYNDWLEIYNPGENAVNLKDKFITDNRTNLKKWKFRRDFIINPGETVLLWCDDDTSQGAAHVNFKLDGDGEFVALIDSNAVDYIDSVSFGQQQVDISWGRDVNEVNTWGFMEPTPGDINTVVSVEDQHELIPDKFSLSAYPNPFNSSTKIEFYNSHSTEVSLLIFNTLGQMVWSRGFGELNSGNYSINWSGINNKNISLASGVYLVSVHAGEVNKSIKIILVK